MHDANDSKWVEAWRGGNQEAFRMLVDTHANAVYNLAYRMCGQAATAEDIAQETFIRAHQRQHQYNPQYSFRNWVLGICANLTRSRYRGWRRKRTLEEAYARDVERTRETEREAQTDRMAMLEQALMRLPETLRAPIVLNYMEAMPLQQIAEVLNIGLSAVKMRLSRARQQLRDILRDADKGTDDHEHTA